MRGLCAKLLTGWQPCCLQAFLPQVLATAHGFRQMQNLSASASCRKSQHPSSCCPYQNVTRLTVTDDTQYSGLKHDAGCPLGLAGLQQPLQRELAGLEAQASATKTEG